MINGQVTQDAGAGRVAEAPRRCRVISVVAADRIGGDPRQLDLWPSPPSKNGAFKAVQAALDGWKPFKHATDKPQQVRGPITSAQPKFLLLDRIGVPAPKPAPGWDEVEVADRDEFVARAPSAVIGRSAPPSSQPGSSSLLPWDGAGGWGSYHAFASRSASCRSSGRASRTARSAPARTAAAPLLNRIEKPRRRPRRSRRPRFPPPSEPPVEDTSLRALRLNEPLRRRSETPQRRSRPQLHRRRRRASPASAPGCRPSPYRCRRRGRPRSRLDGSRGHRRDGSARRPGRRVAGGAGGGAWVGRIDSIVRWGNRWIVATSRA